jgi:hypothetical protein
MCVKSSALDVTRTIVRVDDQQDIVEDIRHDRVIVFIPNDDDGVAALFPERRLVNAFHDLFDSRVAATKQGGVEAGLPAVVCRVIGANSGVIAAAVLIVALVGRNEGEVRRRSGTKVDVKTARSIEPYDAREAEVWILSFLNALEIGERIMLHGIKLDYF